MTGFQHDIAGGQGNLIVTSVQSPNFVAGSAGWQVKKDGSAEFNNLVIRGTFDGADFEINSSGMFFYDGTPANGNLIIAIARAAGTDAFGNAYVRGIQLGEPSDTAQIQLLPSAGGPGTASRVAFPIPGLGISNIPNVSAGITSGTYGALLMSGPAMNTAGAQDWVQLIMFANSLAGNAAHGELRYIDTSGNVTTDALWDGSGVMIPSLAGQDPANGLRETWHSLGSPSATGWASQHGRYRMTPEGETEMDINLTGSGSTGTFNYANALAAAYRPSIKRVHNLGMEGITTSPCQVTVATTGVVTLRIGATTSTIGDTWAFPLD